MAVGILGTDYTYGSVNNISLNYTSHSGNNKKMLAAVTVRATTPTISGVTFNSVGFSSWFSYIQGDVRTSLYYLDDSSFPSTPGSYTLGCSTGGTNPKVTLTMMEIEDAVQGAIAGTGAGGSSDGTPVDVSVTPTTEGSLVFCWSGRGAALGIDTTMDGSETYIYDDLIFDFSGFDAAYVVHQPPWKCSCVVDISSANNLVAGAVAVDTTVDPFSTSGLFFGGGL